MKLRIYLTVVTYKGGVYEITFPDFPGVSALEFNRKEVSATAEEILTIHAGKLVDSGQKLPDMTSRGMYGREEFAEADYIDFVAIVENDAKSTK